MNSKRELHSTAMRLLAELCSGSREGRWASSVASSLLMNYKPEQIGIGDLLVASQVPSPGSKRLANFDAFRPKTMLRDTVHRRRGGDDACRGDRPQTRPAAITAPAATP